MLRARSRARGGTSGASFTPASISGLALWLDANDPSTISQSGNAVSQWDDKSINGYNATSSGTNRPTTSVATLNGKNVISFDGTDDYMSLPSGTYSIPSGDATMFVVYRDNANLIYKQPICAKDGGSNRFRFMALGSTQFCSVHGNSAQQSSVLTTVGSTAGYIALMVSPDNGTNQRFYRSGVAEVGNNAVRTTFTATSFTVGAQDSTTNYWQGDIAEILIYTRVLTATERNQVGAYLASKWGAGYTNF